jgi:hypothetical protein
VFQLTTIAFDESKDNKLGYIANAIEDNSYFYIKMFWWLPTLLLYVAVLEVYSGRPRCEEAVHHSYNTTNSV